MPFEYSKPFLVDLILLFFMISITKIKIAGHCFQHNIGYWSNDILDNESQLFVDTAEDCQVACYERDECNAWSYIKTNQRCFLKSTVGNDIIFVKNFISGPKTCDA